MSFSLTKVASKTTPISRKPESITSIFAQPNSRGFPALPNELYLEILSYYPSHPVPPHRLDTKEEKEYAIQRYPTLLSLCHTCRSLRRFFLRYLWERVEIRPVDSSSSSSSSDGASVSEEGLGLGLGFGLGVHPTINAGQTFDGMTTLPFPGLSKAPRAVVCISESDDGTKAQQWTRKVTNERRAEILSSQLSVLLEENPSSRVATEYVRTIDLTLHSHLFEDIFSKLVRLLCRTLKNVHTLRLDIRCRRSLIWVIDANLREPQWSTATNTTTPKPTTDKLLFTSIRHLHLSSNTLQFIKHAPNVITLTPSNTEDAFGLIDLMIHTQTAVESLQILGPVRYTSRWMNEFGARFPSLRQVSFCIPAVPISKQSLSELSSLAQLKNLHKIILERDISAEATEDDNLRNCCIKVAKDLELKTVITIPTDGLRKMSIKDRETACIHIHR